MAPALGRSYFFAPANGAQKNLAGGIPSGAGNDPNQSDGLRIRRRSRERRRTARGGRTKAALAGAAAAPQRLVRTEGFVRLRLRRPQRS
jgi:hypothetical protein